MEEVSRDDVVEWVGSHGDVLFRYAFSRVEKREVAEDLVQETFLYALRGLKDFQGRSKVQTWLIGILKHKIIDHFRKTQRRRQTSSSIDDDLVQLFHNGHWRQPVKAWPVVPDHTSHEFWEAIDDCEEKLPDKLQAAFRMRDIEALETREICEMLSISPGNLSVRLHRARLLLRDCLERNWF